MDEKKSWRIPKIELHETVAFQAFNRGEANEAQQKMVLKCIIEKMCGYYDQQFHPESIRFTDFYLGRRDVAGQILKELALPVAKLREKAQSKEKLK